MIFCPLYIFCSLGLIFPLVYAACQSSLLAIPIQNTTLPNKARVYGASVAIGTPAQNISLYVNADYNETYVFGPNGFCEDSFSNDECTTFRGGRYGPDDSSTNTKAEDRRQSDNVAAAWVADSFKLTPNLTLSDYEFGIAQADLYTRYAGHGHVGLGRNSSLLSTLKAARHIGSRTFSLFWGLVGGPRRVPGSLVLGGFDQSIAGRSANYTAPIVYGQTPVCSTGMLITINDIQLNWPNGTDSSIFSGARSAAMQACIVTHFAGLMTLPLDYWDEFRSLAGGTYLNNKESRTFGLNFFTMLFEPENVYYGDLTISIQNGIKVRVPNTQLVVPEPTIDENGQLAANNSARNIVINSIQGINEKDLPILGRLFLSSAYLMVNHDVNTFTLWQAETDAESSNLQAVGEDGKLVGELCPNDVPANGSETEPTPSASTIPTGTPRKSISAGAIGGIVVGILFGVAAFGFSGICVWRRKHREHKSAIAGQYEQGKPEQGYPGIPYSTLELADSSVQGVPKQPHEMFQPQELATRRTEPMELDSTTVPSANGVR